MGFVVPKLKRYEIHVLIFTFVYICIFVFYFLLKQNKEFSFYAILLFFMFFVLFYNIRRANLSPFVLWGLSILGAFHLFGGSVYIFGERLYDVLSFGLINLEGEFVLLKYDQIIHFCSTFFACVGLFELFKNRFPEIVKKRDLSFVYVVMLFATFGIASFNEIIEFAPGYFFNDDGVGGYVNTILDLCFNFMGAALGIFFVSRYRVKRDDNKKES